jgi:hypothetical protein
MPDNTVLEKDTRQKLSFDFDDDQPEVDQNIHQKIEEISERVGFKSRSPQYKPREQSLIVANDKPIQRRHRRKTGRTLPFSTKMREDTYAKICFMADIATENEGRPVTLSEILERSIDLLESKMKSEGQF